VVIFTYIILVGMVTAGKSQHGQALLEIEDIMPWWPFCMKFGRRGLGDVCDCSASKELGGRVRESVWGLFCACFVPFIGNLSDIQAEAQVLS
jgi:hypothetical protein